MRTIEEIFAAEGISVTEREIRTSDATFIVRDAPTLVRVYEPYTDDWVFDEKSNFAPLMWFIGLSVASFWAFFAKGPQLGFPVWIGYILVAGVVFAFHALMAAADILRANRNKTEPNEPKRYTVEVEAAGAELAVFSSKNKDEADLVRERIEEIMLESKGY